MASLIPHIHIYLLADRERMIERDALTLRVLWSHCNRECRPRRQTLSRLFYLSTATAVISGNQGERRWNKEGNLAINNALPLLYHIQTRFVLCFFRAKKRMAGPKRGRRLTTGMRQVVFRVALKGGPRLREIAFLITLCRQQNTTF